MILLLNGAFGVGKTTVAEALIAARPEWVLFDSEDVGQVLRKALDRVQPVDDFQEYSGWVPLVVATAAELRRAGRHLVLPICVADRDRYVALGEGLARVDSAFFPFCLKASPGLIHGRLRERGDDPEGWAGVRTGPCCDAHEDPIFGPFLDASRTVNELVDEILSVTGEA